MFASVDAQTGRIVECNETLAQLLRYPKQELLGRRFFDLCAPASRDAMGEVFHKLQSTGEARAEFELQRADGGALHVSFEASALRNEDGAALYGRAVLWDISERKRAEAARQASEARFGAIVEGSHDLISELDRKGNHTWISPNVTETLGWEIGEFLPTHPRDFVHPDDFEHCVEGFAEALKTGRTRLREYRYRRKGGGWVWLESSVTVYTNAEGGPRIVCVSRDVSERRRQLRQREAAIREKEKALAQLRVLSGLLPICTHCRKVRDDEGYWRNLETYISAHSNAVFSHSLCEVCLKQHYGEIIGDDE
jgi:PAS domain S-box-containing protein